MEKEYLNTAIKNLKEIAKHLDKNWEGLFSLCDCGAYLIGHYGKCPSCGSSDLMFLQEHQNPIDHRSKKTNIDKVFGKMPEAKELLENDTVNEKIDWLDIKRWKSK